MENEKRLELSNILSKAKNIKTGTYSIAKSFDIKIVDQSNIEDNTIEFENIEEFNSSFHKILDEKQLLRLTEKITNELNTKEIKTDSTFKVKLTLS